MNNSFLTNRDYYITITDWTDIYVLTKVNTYRIENADLTDTTLSDLYDNWVHAHFTILKEFDIDKSEEIILSNRELNINGIIYNLLICGKYINVGSIYDMHSEINVNTEIPVVNY